MGVPATDCGGRGVTVLVARVLLSSASVGVVRGREADEGDDDDNNKGVSSVPFLWHGPYDVIVVARSSLSCCGVVSKSRSSAFCSSAGGNGVTASTVLVLVAVELLLVVVLRGVVVLSRVVEATGLVATVAS